MTVVFVAPDDSDDEDLSTFEGENQLKYKFITEETEHKNRASATSQESNQRSRDATLSNGNESKSTVQRLDNADAVSIDSSQR